MEIVTVYYWRMGEGEGDLGWGFIEIERDLEDFLEVLETRE